MLVRSELSPFGAIKSLVSALIILNSARAIGANTHVFLSVDAENSTDSLAAAITIQEGQIL